MNRASLWLTCLFATMVCTGSVVDLLSDGSHSATTSDSDFANYFGSQWVPVAFGDLASNATSREWSRLIHHDRGDLIRRDQELGGSGLRIELTTNGDLSVAVPDPRLSLRVGVLRRSLVTGRDIANRQVSLVSLHVRLQI
jgi:hypothetical protein